jgi:hypothetical protein
MGSPKQKKSAAGRPPCGPATPKMALRLFQGWPARRAYKAGPTETLGSPWPPLAVRLRWEEMYSGRGFKQLQKKMVLENSKSLALFIKRFWGFQGRHIII